MVYSRQNKTGVIIMKKYNTPELEKVLYVTEDVLDESDNATTNLDDLLPGGNTVPTNPNTPN